jgi:hypothetical protein
MVPHAGMGFLQVLDTLIQAKYIDLTADLSSGN